MGMYNVPGYWWQVPIGTDRRFEEGAPLTYQEWTELWGKYRWYHKDGTARTTLPLDYEWEHVYKQITQQTDLYFANWKLPENITEFTDRFLALVPTAWLKTKTEFEMFLGTLNGKTIDPLMFEAGFTRTTDSNTERDGTFEGRSDGDSSSISNSEENTTQDSYTDSHHTDAGSKGRNLSYQQGVQGLNNINEGNIGALGNKYASGIADTIAASDNNTDDDYGERRGHSTNVGDVTSEYSNNDTRTEDVDTKFHETVKETRINYYDNLAFLRERADRLKLIKPFYSHFEHIFTLCKALCKNW